MTMDADLLRYPTVRSWHALDAQSAKYREDYSLSPEPRRPWAGGFPRSVAGWSGSVIHFRRKKDKGAAHAPLNGTGEPGWSRANGMTRPSS